MSLMEIVPAARAARGFEQLEAGELFIYMDGSADVLRPQDPAAGDRRSKRHGASRTLIYSGCYAESFLVPWQPVTVLSFGKSFSILPSLDPAAWSPTGPSRTPVCLAIADENVYICTNGGHFTPALFRMLRRRKDGCDCRGAPPELGRLYQ